MCVTCFTFVGMPISTAVALASPWLDMRRLSFSTDDGSSFMLSLRGSRALSRGDLFDSRGEKENLESRGSLFVQRESRAAFESRALPSPKSGILAVPRAAGLEFAP